MKINPYQLLQTFAQADDPGVALPLLQDYRLCSTVNSWRSMDVSWTPPAEIDVEGSDAKTWQELWDYSVWDVEELSIMTNLSEEEAMLLHARARMLRLIYPDGTISDSAVQALRVAVSRKTGLLNPFAGGEASEDEDGSGEEDGGTT